MVSLLARPRTCMTPVPSHLHRQLMPQTPAYHIHSPKAPPVCPQSLGPMLASPCVCTSRACLARPLEHTTLAPDAHASRPRAPAWCPSSPCTDHTHLRPIGVPNAHASYLPAPCLDTASPMARLHSTVPASSHAASMSLPCPVCPHTATVPALPCTSVPACNNTSFTEAATTHWTLQGWAPCCPCHY